MRRIEVRSRRPIIQPRQSHFTTQSNAMSGMRMDIQRDMEDELNKRREQWESKLDHMQKDFFNDGRREDELNKDFFGEVRGAKRDIPISSKPVFTSNNEFDVDLLGTEYFTLEEGVKGYKLKYSVKGYKEDDLSVNLEGITVTLSACHEEKNASGSSNKKTINRKVDLPRDVNPDTISSSISDDGDVLTIEAALKVVEKKSIADPPSYENNKVDPTGLNGYIPYRKKTSTIQYIEDSEYGEMFKLQLDMGSQYKAEDIKIHVLQTKFTIKAKSETVTGGCRSINKWTRDFNIPKKIVEMKAFFENDVGTIYCYGIFTDVKDAEKAMECGRKDIPISAKQCEIINQ